MLKKRLDVNDLLKRAKDQEKNDKKLNSIVEKINSTGFDAISQSIESLISKKSNEKSILFAKKSLELSLKNYLNFLTY